MYNFTFIFLLWSTTEIVLVDFEFHKQLIFPIMGLYAVLFSPSV